MTAFTISFGVNGRDSAWYLRNGPTGFQPINTAPLPGPKPGFARVADQLVVSYTQESFSGELLFKNRVGADTEGGVTVVDQLPDWNTVKNVQILSEGAQDLFLDGFVHVDAQLGLGDAAGSRLVLNGTKRANIVTGAGDDLLDIRMVADQNSVWVDDFRISTGAGRDTVKLSGLDIAAELAAGDMTYVQAANKPGLDLVATGVGRVSYTATGAGDDLFQGYASNDHVIAGTDDGSVEQVMADCAPSGFGYAVGGSTGRGCDSVLYKINLATGAATAVGEVEIGLGKWLSVGGLDIESLSLSPKDGQLYGFASKFGILDALVRIDPLTAKTTYIKLNLSGLRAELQDSAFDDAGDLYLASCGNFMKVDVATGAITAVGRNTIDKKIGALAIDPDTGKVWGLSEYGSKGTVLYEIDKATGKTLSASKLAGLGACGAIEGMSFDSAGVLWAVDRVSGQIVRIDVDAKTAAFASRTLTDAKMYGDGFEALAIRTDADSKMAGLKAVGGDVIATGAGADHLWYAAGDGVDRVTDFDKVADKLHIAGYAADRVQIDVYGDTTFIRFKDGSADGFVDDAMIELTGVTGFDASMIVYDATPWG